MNKKTLLAIILLCCSITVGIISCSNIPLVQNTDDKTDGRIEIIESKCLNGHCYQIIRVDGKEFLTVYQGGIIKL
jgi:hypothetical protein